MTGAALRALSAKNKTRHRAAAREGVTRRFRLLDYDTYAARRLATERSDGSLEELLPNTFIRPLARVIVSSLGNLDTVVDTRDT